MSGRVHRGVPTGELPTTEIVDSSQFAFNYLGLPLSELMIYGMAVSAACPSEQQVYFSGPHESASILCLLRWALGMLSKTSLAELSSQPLRLSECPGGHRQVSVGKREAAEARLEAPRLLWRKSSHEAPVAIHVDSGQPPSATSRSRHLSL